MMTANPPLPTALQAHHQDFIAYFRSKYGEGTPVPFIQYMEEALYAPGLGYYSAGATKIGADGDFITAPEISPMFSQALAQQAQQVLAHLGGGDLLELGPGRGVMAANVLLALDEAECLPAHYYCLERSADLRERQHMYLKEHLPPHVFERVVWLNAPPQAFTGMILANEVVDALPVALFHMTEDGMKERYVVLNGDQFEWRNGKMVTPHLQDIIASLAGQPFSVGYQSEVQPYLEGWLQSITDGMQRGVVLLIDYGFPQREYYHPERSMGTLKCHYHHQSADDPLVRAGCQDITAHVDFTRLAWAGHQAGLDVMGYTSQAAFLLSTSMLVSASQREGEVVGGMRTQAAMHQLISPNEMGEMFKVMAFGRDCDLPLMGFAHFDRRDKL